MRALDQRQVGTSGVASSVLGFGGGPMGNLMEQVPEGTARDTMLAAVASGLRYFDTSPYYGHGLSEHRLGAVLRDIPRDRFVISTKVGRLLRPGRPAKSPGPFVNYLPFTTEFDYSYEGAMRSFEDSLQRLGLDRIDIALIHDVSPLAQGDALEARFREAVAGAYRALRSLRDAGVVRAIGLGVSDWRICMRFARECEFDVFLLACRYTLLDQEPLREFLPFCLERKISVIAAAPFVSGILAGGAKDGRYFYQDAPHAVIERVQAIERICTAHAVPLPAAALQMPVAHPAVCSVLPGFRSVAEVLTNIDCFERPIPSAFWQELKHEGLLAPDTPTPE